MSPKRASSATSTISIFAMVSQLYGNRSRSDRDTARATHYATVRLYR
jgi:hypothetical protein